MAFVPAAGEAAGPPIQSREIIASSSSLRGTYGGPAAPPAAGTNVAFSSGGAMAFVPAAGEAAGPPGPLPVFVNPPQHPKIPLKNNPCPHDT
jgi:hypothetical protein